jgi:hypothetical protein
MLSLPAFEWLQDLTERSTRSNGLQDQSRQILA